MKKTLLFLFSLVYAFVVKSQDRKPLVFLGTIHKISIPDVDYAKCWVNIKVDSVLLGKLDTTGCDKSITVRDLNYQDFERGHDGLMEVSLPDLKKNSKIKEKDKYLFFLKDSIIDVVERKKEREGSTSLFGDWVHDCYVSEYHKYDSLFFFNKKVLDLYGNFIVQKGQGDLKFDLQSTGAFIIPNTVLEIQFEPQKHKDRLRVIYAKDDIEKTLYDTGYIVGGIHRFTVPLKGLNPDHIRLDITSSKKKSIWSIQYGLHNQFFK